MRAEKIEKEPGYAPLMQLVSEELQATVEEPWPSGLSEAHREALSEATYCHGRSLGSLLVIPSNSYPVVVISFFPTFWETSTQENLALEASDRPETG